MKLNNVINYLLNYLKKQYGPPNMNKGKQQEEDNEDLTLKERIIKLEKRVVGLERTNSTLKWVFGKFLPGIATVISMILTIIWYFFY